MRAERRRRGENRHALQLPKELAFEIVRTNLARGGGDDFRAQVVFPDEWSSPAFVFFARHSPQFFAGFLVERGEEGLRGVVVDDVQTVLVQRGRGAGAVLAAAVQSADIPGPDGLAVEIQRREQSDGSEVNVYALAIGDRCF